MDMSGINKEEVEEEVLPSTSAYENIYATYELDIEFQLTGPLVSVIITFTRVPNPIQYRLQRDYLIRIRMKDIIAGRHCRV